MDDCDLESLNAFRIKMVLQNLTDLRDFVKNLEGFKDIPISPKIAYILNVCRICRADCNGSVKMTLNYGEEYAHTDCYNASRFSGEHL